MEFLPSCSCVGTIVWLHHLDFIKTKHLEKKLDGNYTKMLCALLDTSWKKYSTKKAAEWTSHKPSKEDELDRLDSVGEIKVNSLMMFFYETPMYFFNGIWVI